MNTEEASLPHLPLTSCCAGRFLTGYGPAAVHDLGVGGPCNQKYYEPSFFQAPTFIYTEVCVCVCVCVCTYMHILHIYSGIDISSVPLIS